MQTVEYDPEGPLIHMIDQRQLPGNLEILALRDLEQVIHAIREMAVRGAPAIGISAAFGLALSGRVSTISTIQAWKIAIEEAAARLLKTRPTAINLRWAVDQVLSFVDSFNTDDIEFARSQLDTLVQTMADNDVENNRRMARVGSELISDKATVIHHCNTGALAAVDYGTALGVIRYAHEAGKQVHVLVDETRPRLQGSRLTAWELDRYGISYDIITDGAAGYFLQTGEISAVLVGADRVAANGDVANKIGTYMLALAAQASSVPFYCVAPRSTFDMQTAAGMDIPIEERSPDEVLSIQLNGAEVVPNGASARNPAFDITPFFLVTAFITEHGLLYPPYLDSLQAMHEKSDI